MVWFDAHADFDTPDDNLSGFFDVMGLAILTGTGWSALRQTIPGFAPVPRARRGAGGGPDLEPYQRTRLESAEIRAVAGPLAGNELVEELDGLRRDVARVYLHVDLDSLDIGVGRANEYAAAGGPTLTTIGEGTPRFGAPTALAVRWPTRAGRPARSTIEAAGRIGG